LDLGGDSDGASETYAVDGRTYDAMSGRALVQDRDTVEQKLYAGQNGTAEPTWKTCLNYAASAWQWSSRISQLFTPGGQVQGAVERAKNILGNVSSKWSHDKSLEPADFMEDGMLRDLAIMKWNAPEQISWGEVLQVGALYGVADLLGATNLWQGWTGQAIRGESYLGPDGTWRIGAAGQLSTLERGLNFVEAGVKYAGAVATLYGGLSFAADGVLASRTAAMSVPTRGAAFYGELDALGRPTGVDAIITQDMIGTGSPASSAIRPPGFQGGAWGHARGHLLGAQLGGSGTNARNLITIRQVPANTPVMRGVEFEIRAVVEGGQTVNLTVTPIYNSTYLIPQGITMVAEGSGEYRLEHFTVNYSGIRRIRTILGHRHQPPFRGLGRWPSSARRKFGVLRIGGTP